jgi:hypothetical protein
MGKSGEQVGDTLEVPGLRLVYDFLAFVELGHTDRHPDDPPRASWP